MLVKVQNLGVCLLVGERREQRDGRKHRLRAASLVGNFLTVIHFASTIRVSQFEHGVVVNVVNWLGLLSGESSGS